MTLRSIAALASLELSSPGFACQCYFGAFEVERGKHRAQNVLQRFNNTSEGYERGGRSFGHRTIDRHETVLTFVSKDDAEKFAQVEHATLSANDENASQRFREIAYHLWQEEGCPEGEALRHWFAPKAGR